MRVGPALSLGLTRANSTKRIVSRCLLFPFLLLPPFPYSYTHTTQGRRRSSLELQVYFLDSWCSSAKPSVSRSNTIQCLQEQMRFLRCFDPSYWTNTLLKRLCVALSRITPQQRCYLVVKPFSVFSREPSSYFIFQFLKIHLIL